MTTIKDLNRMSLKDLWVICFKHNIGISIGKDGNIKGIIPYILKVV